MPQAIVIDFMLQVRIMYSHHHHISSRCNRLARQRLRPQSIVTVVTVIVFVTPPQVVVVVIVVMVLVDAEMRVEVGARAPPTSAATVIASSSAARMFAFSLK